VFVLLAFNSGDSDRSDRSDRSGRLCVLRGPRIRTASRTDRHRFDPHDARRTITGAAPLGKIVVCVSRLTEASSRVA
jgi:hypothetical protein